jgi:hypothetical protein
MTGGDYRVEVVFFCEDDRCHYSGPTCPRCGSSISGHERPRRLWPWEAERRAVAPNPKSFAR